MAVSISRRAALSAAIAALSGGLAAILLDAPSQASPQASELPVVKVRAPQRQFVNDWQEYSGRLEAVEQVEIRPRVEGTLLSVHFRDGQLVREGDLLFTIDPAPFEAELKRAQAVLAQAQDRQRYTAGELERGRRLLAANAAAKRDVDALENAAREARSATQAALAAVERARLDVGYARIRAPITGRISRPEVTAGNVVKAGGDAMPLAAIVTLDPLYAAFHADEHTYLRYFGGRAGDESVQVQVGLAGEEGFPHAGRLYSVDNRLDTRSGTIRMRALVDNADGRQPTGAPARRARWPCAWRPHHRRRSGARAARRPGAGGRGRLDRRGAGAMNISRFFIDRPIFAGVLSVLMFLAGAIAMFQLPVSEYPQVVPPSVVVHAQYPGANASTIAETVAAPIEEAVNGVENMLYMQSLSNADGHLYLTVTFKLGTSPDQAQQWVQNRVSQALPRLPEDVQPANSISATSCGFTHWISGFALGAFSPEKGFVSVARGLSRDMSL